MTSKIVTPTIAQMRRHCNSEEGFFNETDSWSMDTYDHLGICLDMLEAVAALQAKWSKYVETKDCAAELGELLEGAK